MMNENINLLDSKAEKQRFIFSMLPSELCMRATREGKNLERQMTKDLPKKDYRQKIHFAHILNELATTQAYPHNIDMRDIRLEPGELSSHPYECLLRSLGAETADELLKHSKVVDSCLNRKFNSQIIIELKAYLSKSFSYEDNELSVNMPAGEFYLYMILSFIAHIDACIHHTAYSGTIAPISLGWLFMHKLDLDKWKHDPKNAKYIFTNKNGSPFTCTSHSFISLMQTIFYLQIYGGMPTSLYNIESKIVKKEFDRTGFRSESFIRKKKEGAWISLEDVFWLVGAQSSKNNDANEVLAIWQLSMIDYIKTNDIDHLGGLPPSPECILWFIYAFFQSIYEQTEKSNKANKEQSCVIYDVYYDLWESMTDYYESKISFDIKGRRIEWPDYLRKQATRTERMT